MDAYTAFFTNNIVLLKLGNKKIRVSSLCDAKCVFLDYIRHNNLKPENLKSTDGNLISGRELIATFSYNGRLWSSDEEEIIIS